MIAAGDGPRLVVATPPEVGAAVARAAIVTELTIETPEEAVAQSDASCTVENPAIVDVSARPAQHAAFCGAIHGIPVRCTGHTGVTEKRRDNRVGL
jgi:hypothetical protein